MDRREAAAFVKTLDVQLAKWTKFLYGVDWQDPLLYDVVVNLERLGVAGTVNTLIHMTRLDDFRPTDESRKAFDDLLLGSRVWAALSTDPRTRSANVRVAADSQMIFVTGMADNDRVATAVQEVAAGVDGVGRVNSEVGVGRNWSW